MNEIKDLTGYIRGLGKAGTLYKFYKTKQWKNLRNSVLINNHFECRRCALAGRYSRATMVHHVNEVLKRPDLALSMFYTDQDGVKRENLIPLCAACHEAMHGRFFPDKPGYNTYSKQDRFTNQERW